jgi:hypothetical protein
MSYGHHAKWFLVLTSRAKPPFWSIKYGKISLDRHCIVLERQMRRLVTLMVGSCQSHRGQEVKADHTIRLWVVNRFAFRCRLQSFMIRICNGMKET